MADDDMEIINPPNTLKDKVREGGPGAVDLATLERAENVIAEMADSYLEWVQEDLVRIEAAYKALTAAAGNRKQEAEHGRHAGKPQDRDDDAGRHQEDDRVVQPYVVCRGLHARPSRPDWSRLIRSAALRRRGTPLQPEAVLLQKPLQWRLDDATHGLPHNVAPDDACRLPEHRAAAEWIP